jgi:PAS domain S-box-containing protein
MVVWPTRMRDSGPYLADRFVSALDNGESLPPGEDRRLAATYEHAGIGISEVDAEGKLRRVNAHLAGLLGWKPEELLGRSIFDPALSEEIARDQEQFRRQVNGEIGFYTVEKRFRRPDGSKLWVSVTSSSICDESGRFLYAVRIQQDITPQRLAEAALARRAEEQGALYEFIQGMQHASGLEEIYALALGALVRAIGCERASVLLFDNRGVMRFAASRGLSESYRRAVEGHSPWRPDTVNPAPICIGDLETSDLSGSLKHTIRTEGIAALAFIPIAVGGRLLGKFMIYYGRPHIFEEPEKNLALTLARQLGFAIERLRNEEVRKRWESAACQLVAIVESSNDAIVSKDLDGIIATWNAGAERLFGYKAEEAVGRPMTILIPQERLAEEPEILWRINRGERVEPYETVRRRKDGSLASVSVTVSPVRDGEGNIAGASNIARDITERKEAEAKLRESQQQMKELLAAMPAAIYTTGAEGKVTYYNEAAAALAGRTPVLGSDEWCVSLKLYRPDGTPLPYNESPMAIALKERRAIRDAEAIAERPDGTRVPFIPYPTPLRDSKGNVTGAINLLVDISERKQAETQQRTLFNELNHRVKNNMQMVHSLLQMMGRQTESGEAQMALREAGQCVAAMAAAQQVLYGKPGADSFNARQFLSAVCQAARQGLSPEVRIRSEAEDLELPNDTGMPLALILKELIANAAKHGMNGSGGAILVRLGRENGSFRLSVEDGGLGFDLDSVPQRAYGLKLVQGLARQLRGRFEAARDPTRCSVLFP